MTQQIINIGSIANDKTGDPIRTAFTKVNNNFTELYANSSSLPSQLTFTVNNTTNMSEGIAGAFLCKGGGTFEKSVYIQDSLHVGPGANADTGVYVNPVFVGQKSGSTYVQAAIINTNGFGSADIVAIADNGTESEGWCDLGMTGSTFSDPAYSITEAGEGYIFAQGVNDGISHGSLVLCTGTAGLNKDIIFGTGGFTHDCGRITLEHSAQRFHINMLTQATPEAQGALWCEGGATIDANVVTGGAYVASSISVVGGIDTQNTTSISLSKQIVKLNAGYYSLADGFEGQILRVVRKTGLANTDTCRIYISNKSRAVGVESINRYIDPFTNGADVVTFIYTDGAWQSSGGQWG